MLNLKIGNAFDVVAERKQIDHGVETYRRLLREHKHGPGGDHE